MLELRCVLGYSTVPGSQCGSDPGLVTSQLCHKTFLDLSFLTYKMEIIILCPKIIVRRIRCVHRWDPRSLIMKTKTRGSGLILLLSSNSPVSFEELLSWNLDKVAAPQVSIVPLHSPGRKGGIKSVVLMQ